MDDTPKPGRSFKSNFLLLMGSIALILCSFVTAVLVSVDAPTPTPAAQAEGTANEVPATPPTPRSLTNTPQPASHEAALRQTIDETLGESNRDLGRKLNLFDIREDEGSISVGWAADDNLSNDLIVTGMQLDTVEILRAIDQSGIPYHWIFIGSTFAMQDQFGNAGEIEVLTLSYPKTTIDRINWDNFSFSDVFDIANVYVLHPAFETD